MKMQDYALLGLVALILAGVLATSLNVTATANGASTRFHSIDLSGLTRTSAYLPEEDIPAH